MYNLVGAHSPFSDVVTVQVTLDQLYLVHGAAVYAAKTYKVNIESLKVRVAAAADQEKSR